MGGADFADKKWILQSADAFSNKTEIALNWGMFVNAIIDFLIVAFAIFIVIKAMNKMKKPAPVAEAVTKECAFCHTAISIKATRCPNCTSQLA
jgi:large conductance mechanosensitive channel